MKFLKILTPAQPRSSARKFALGTAIGGLCLGAMALVARRQSSNAEQSHPAVGKFLDVEGVRLHYVERGAGDVLLLIHGNGTQIEDFETSGLIGLAAETHRVIVFDRPGFGHSSRPMSKIWTPSAQADLLFEALTRLGVDRCVVLGHSWGAAVAVALALRHASAVKALVLVSGYYYPTDRFDAILQFLQASPIIGDVMRYTLSPLLGRLGWSGLMKKIFAPAPVSQPFSDAIKEMALRPSQLHSTAAESTLMIPNAIEMQNRYGELTMPVSIVVGGDDRLINASSQSIRLHDDISGSALCVIPGIGHMVHHEARAQVMSAIKALA
jgi:pimeloyl-ACP methyl ester carboxylesterase